MTLTKERSPILYNGDLYIKTETEDEIILTSVEKKYGRHTILSFSKNEEKSTTIKNNITNMIKQSIIHNFYNRQGK